MGSCCFRRSYSSSTCQAVSHFRCRPLLCPLLWRRRPTGFFQMHRYGNVTTLLVIFTQHLVWYCVADVPIFIADVISSSNSAIFHKPFLVFSCVSTVTDGVDCGSRMSCLRAFAIRRKNRSNKGGNLTTICRYTVG